MLFSYIFPDEDIPALMKEAFDYAIAIEKVLFSEKKFFKRKIRKNIKAEIRFPFMAVAKNFSKSYFLGNFFEKLGKNRNLFPFIVIS